MYWTWCSICECLSLWISVCASCSFSLNWDYFDSYLGDHYFCAPSSQMLRVEFYYSFLHRVTHFPALIIYFYQGLWHQCQWLSFSILELLRLRRYLPDPEGNCLNSDCCFDCLTFAQIIGHYYSNALYSSTSSHIIIMMIKFAYSSGENSMT